MFDGLKGRFAKPADDGSAEQTYLRMQWKRLMLLLGLVLVAFLAAVAGIAFGAVDLPFIETLQIVVNDIFLHAFGDIGADTGDDVIVTTLRMPRIVLCLLTGASLGMAGAIMQGLLRNPLVSPFTLGVSTAAAFGAAMAIVFGTSILGTAYYASFSFLGQYITVDTILKTIAAFGFGVLSIIIVLQIARKTNISRSTLILSGVIVSYIFQSGLMLAKFLSDDAQLRDITMWMMGGFTGTTWGMILIVLPIVVVCGIYLEKLAVDINALSSGDDVASNLGVDVKKLRNRGLFISTLIASVCIAFTGTIGFVGLMAPHLCRMIIGNDHRYLVPASALLGAIILVISDLFARLVMRPAEIPVGVIMYVIGGIFFMWLVFKGKAGENA